MRESWFDAPGLASIISTVVFFTLGNRNEMIIIWFESATILLSFLREDKNCIRILRSGAGKRGLKDLRRLGAVDSTSNAAKERLTRACDRHYMMHAGILATHLNLVDAYFLRTASESSRHERTCRVTFPSLSHLLWGQGWSAQTACPARKRAESLHYSR